VRGVKPSVKWKRASAQSPSPPEILGHQDGKEGIDPLVYDYIDGDPVRKSIEYAKRLLAELGIQMESPKRQANG